MKQKKRRKFRKPKPLFHLTTRGKLIIGIYLFVIRLHRVLNHVSNQIQLLHLCLCSFFYHTHSKRLDPVVVACPATATGQVPRCFHGQFDTDSFKIGIDTMCSCTMSGNKHHFEDLREGPTPKTVGGIGDSTLKIAGIGTFVFNILDDTGEVCTVRIPNSLYVPDLKLPLLCPQHWAQAANDHVPKPMGTFVLNFDKGTQMWWDQRKHCRTVFHDACTNTPTFKTAAGTSRIQAFEACFQAMDASHLNHRVELCVPDLHLHTHRSTHPLDPAEFTADEVLLSSKLSMENEGVNSDDETVHTGNHDFCLTDPNQQCPIHPTGNHEWGDCSHYQHALNHQIGQLHYSPLQSLSEADEQNRATQASDDQAELMRWHHRLCHLSFANLKKLAEQGDIPRQLAKVTPPKCAGCMFGAMTKLRTRDKGEKHFIFVATKPGEVISVDTMQSNELGFIAQAKEKLTTHHYKYTTIFVDHFSRVKFIHLHRSNSSAKLVQAKQAFEWKAH